MAKTATRPEGGKRASKKAPNLNHPTYYINRELSWLEFNRRVLQEAVDETVPLLERVKFLSIFSSNLDEFFMIRVAGLRRQLASGILKAPPDGLTPAQQLAEIRERLLPMLDNLTRCWKKDIQPRLAEAGIRIIPYKELKSGQQKLLRKHFQKEIFPILTPLAFDPGHPFPHISNLSMNLAVVINDPGYGMRFARVKVPHLLPRLLPVPSDEQGEEQKRLGLGEVASADFIWSEEVVSANLDLLFPGLEVNAAYPFRITRNADLEIEEDEASDLLEATREMVGQRHFGFVIRLEVDNRMPDQFLSILVENLELAPYQVYTIEGPIGMADLMQLAGLNRPELKDKPFKPKVPPVLQSSTENIFSILQRRDILLYHPYDSFNPIVELLREASSDPEVLAIKQTLYRVGPNSPIVQALKDARENGKQVSALVELKARFDEENNIEWARELEQAGVHVVYGLLGLKTHAKMCLIVRRERDGIIRYVHLGTGNYNPVTARIYTDIGYLTTDPVIGMDVSDIFNALTGYSKKDEFNRILVAPRGMKEAILKNINREIQIQNGGGRGYLIFKMNALQDKDIIRALYKASQAGIKVELQVRGICCLRPGVPRVSENIRVTSVVGRFLEHTRIYYFRNDGEEEILMGSADLMPRNLKGRVETLFPVLDRRILESIRDDILKLHLSDNVKCWKLMPDGRYAKFKRKNSEAAINSQEILLRKLGSWHGEE